MLPTNPRAGRSKSVTRQPISQSRPAGHPMEKSSPSGRADSGGTGERGRMPLSGDERPLRTQRSMSSVQRPRAYEQSAPPPPLPRGARGRTPPATSDYAPHSTRSRPPSTRDSDSSASSVITTSSAGSSFLDRMRQKYPASSSSQSSFEIEREPSDSGKTYPRGKDDAIGKLESESVSNDLASYSQAIWDRVATAASTWTWPGTSGDAIAAGYSDSKDSEITRVLKAYHISKANSRSDLPEWLFSEAERRVDKPTRRFDAGDDQSYDDQPTRTRGRGLRDIYDSAATDAPAPISRTRDDGRPQAYGSDTSGGAPSSSRATDRLRAIRDAKRQAATSASFSGHVADGGRGGASNSSDRFDKAAMGTRGSADAYGSDPDHGRHDIGRSSRRDVREMGEPGRRMARARVGLPTNPGGR